MKRKIIEDGWNSYRRVVVPRNASETQVLETRRAFFAGASLLFVTINKLLDMSKPEDATPEDLQMFSDVQDEINQFGAALDSELLGLRTAKH